MNDSDPAPSSSLPEPGDPIKASPWLALSPDATIEGSFTVTWRHRVLFTRNVCDPGNALLENLLTEMPDSVVSKPLLVVMDAGLVRSSPWTLEAICGYFAAREPRLHLRAPPLVLPGGEVAKNDPAVLQTVYREIHRHRIDRHAWVIAVGGGALLDVVGFATATAHRGCRHLRMPTTSLAQADSGVGIKNGVNLFGKKNFVGTFAPPAAVINDFEFLRNLPLRELRSGCVEALKVALIRDSRFFCWIEQQADALRQGRLELIETLVHRCAYLHIRHITEGGDPLESGSARPLDFGHWSAHKLERLSDHRLSHGEAVAIGIALDTLYARNVGLLSPNVADRVLRVLQRLGFQLVVPELDARSHSGQLELLEGLHEFREHLGGQLTLTLLRGIGIAAEVHEYQGDQLEVCIRELKQRPAASSG